MAEEIEDNVKETIHDMDNKEHTQAKQEIKESSGSTQKSYRKRKRHYFNSIRTQMEFYFGDSNLSKDRFLKQLIDKDPYVPLDMFLTFNKIKSLTASTADIAKSLSNSELLELNETQQKVRRKAAPVLDRNVDDKTLYVESIPPNADHEWIRKIFSRFGSVAYVSLPKYSKSRKIKEFGFIEFEHETSVEKAVNAFKEFNGVLSMQETEPKELKSVKAFVKEQKIEEKSKALTAGIPTKHKLEEDTEAPEAKKIKTEDVNTTTEDADDDSDDDSIASSGCDNETANDENKKNQSENSSPTKKKRRKRKKKSETAAKERKYSELCADTSYYELKVLPKRDWKRLRNKYLNLQREKIAELKRKAWKEKQQPKDNSTESVDNAASSPPKKSKQSERKLRRMNMNFYGAGEEEAQLKFNLREAQQNPALERIPLFNYEPGIIVEVNFLEPCVNVKEFKADMRQYSEVKYIDIKEGALHSQIRLESAQAADDFLQQISCAEYVCKILTGEPEKEYWKKIERDREMKMNKQVKVPRKRGREKIKKIIAKQHIRFGDDNE